MIWASKLSTFFLFKYGYGAGTYWAGKRREEKAKGEKQNSVKLSFCLKF